MAGTIDLSDIKESYSILEYCDILIDNGEKWSVHDVSTTPLRDQFKPADPGKTNLGYSDSACWIRFNVTNGHVRKENWIIESEYPLLDRVELYIPRGNGEFVQKKSGRLYHFSIRETDNRKIVFSLPGGKGLDGEYYIRVKTEEILFVTFNLITASAFHSMDHDEQFVLGAFYGIIFVMCLYNLFIFVIVRDPCYLFYVLSIASIAMFLLIDNGFALEYLWPNSPIWGQRAHVVFMGLSIFFITLFARYFMDTRRFTPGLDRLFTVLMPASLVPVLLALIGYYQFGHKLVFNFIGNMAVIIWILTGIVAWKRGSRQAVFFIIAWGVFILLGMASSLSIMLKTDVPYVLRYGIQTGYVFEAVLLSLGLADRIRLLEEQKELSMAEAIEHREKFIQERMRISRDIHDSIGSELTGIILRLVSVTEKERAMEDNGITAIAGRMKMTLERLRDIVHLMSREEDNPIRLEDEIKEYLEHLESTGKFGVTSTIQVSDYSLDQWKMLHVEKIFREWMTNVIRHSGASHINIQWLFRRGKRVLVITDNGSGFDWRPEMENGGFGLNNLTMRVKAMDARARAFGKKGKGTLFFLSLDM